MRSSRIARRLRLLTEDELRGFSAIVYIIEDDFYLKLYDPQGEDAGEMIVPKSWFQDTARGFKHFRKFLIEKVWYSVYTVRAQKQK